MSSYTHLTQNERYHIETMLKQNFSLNAIAKGMGRVGSTLSRELKRNCGQRGYRHQQADKMAKQRHIDKPKAIKTGSGNAAAYHATDSGKMES